MFRLFQDKPTNKLAIDTIIEELKLNNSEKNARILRLLMSARNFLTATEPFFQQQREAHISDKAVINLLNDSAESLDEFCKIAKTDKDYYLAFDYCIQIYSDRLASLKDKHDAIYSYFESASHPLKKFISLQPSPSNPAPRS